MPPPSRPQSGQQGGSPQAVLPQAGYQHPQKKATIWKWVVVGVSALIVVFAIASRPTTISVTKGGKSSQTFSPSASDGAGDSRSADAPTFKNGVLTTPGVKIQIVRYKVIKVGQKGNEYVPQAGYRLLVQDHEPVRRRGQPDDGLP